MGVDGKLYTLYRIVGDKNPRCGPVSYSRGRCTDGFVRNNASIFASVPDINVELKSVMERVFNLFTGCSVLNRRCRVRQIGMVADKASINMKTIGLIGGMSWESTIPYYRYLNEGVKSRLGGLHSAKCILVSVDFHDIERLQQAGDWDAAGVLLADAARKLAGAGADFIVLCTNTMHKVAGDIEAAVSIPLLHIADATAAALQQAGCRQVGLLGTKFTMQQPFYRERLAQLHGIEVLLPNETEQDSLHQIIYQDE